MPSWPTQSACPSRKPCEHQSSKPFSKPGNKSERLEQLHSGDLSGAFTRKVNGTIVHRCHRLSLGNRVWNSRLTRLLT
eukprot:334371-Prorocentrum_minimum.AAC.2